MTARVYAERHGLPGWKVVSLIQRGALKGARIGRIWYVEADAILPGDHAAPEPVREIGRAMIWAAACGGLYLAVAHYLKLKTGLTYRRYQGWVRIAEPRTWDDALTAFVADLPILIVVGIFLCWLVLFGAIPRPDRQEAVDTNRTPCLPGRSSATPFPRRAGRPRPGGVR